MREELEAQLLESREYIERLEQRVSGEGNHQIAGIMDSWAVGRKSGLEDGADAAKAELLPQLEQLTRHVSILKNQLRDEEERHDMEVTVVRREADVHRAEEICPHISAKPINKGTALLCEATYTCTRPMFDHHKSSRGVRPNLWASIAQHHTRYLRTQTRRLQANIFGKSDTLSSQYIILSRRTLSTFVTNTHSVHNSSLTTFSDIIAYSLSLPSQLFSVF
jgi:hypothetical protein